MLTAALCWALLINALTVLRFWYDKRCAVAGRRRVPEADLLMYAAIGGSPGAFAARRLFRHKIRKEPFSTRLMVVAAAQIGVATALLLF